MDCCQTAWHYKLQTNMSWGCLLMHIHISETRKEVDDCLREHGCRPWEYLDRLGILDRVGSNIIAAHCLHLSEHEINLIGEHGITCVHCPNSNLKLDTASRHPCPHRRPQPARLPLPDTDAACERFGVHHPWRKCCPHYRRWEGGVPLFFSGNRRGIKLALPLRRRLAIISPR